MPEQHEKRTSVFIFLSIHPPQEPEPREDDHAEGWQELTTNHPIWSPGDGGVADDKAGPADMGKTTIDDKGNILQESNPQGGETKPTGAIKGKARARRKGSADDTIGILDFLAEIPDDAAATAFVEDVRWGDGVFCPRCTSENVFRVKSGRPMSHRCRTCNRFFSVKVNSAFHESNIPLWKWLYAIYLLHTGRAGVSSCELARQLSITQKSAWHMGHRIREGMLQSGEALSGEVEVDEMYVGGLLGKMHKDRRMMLRETDPEHHGKVIVMGIKERKTGRVWTTIVPSTELETLQRILGERVQPGATVYTDGHPAYEGIEFMFDFAHEVAYHSGTAKQYVREKLDRNGQPVLDGEGNPVLIHTNGIEGFWSLFKRGYRGVYFYISPKHLHRYLNESCFRQSTGNRNNLDVIRDTVRRMFGNKLTHKRLTGKA